MQKAMLVILDGFGIGKDYEGNCISLADTSTFDMLVKNYPHTSIKASGLAVGLPDGQMGNSEVGHLNIGAGRVIYQDFTKINRDIETGEFLKKKKFLQAIEHAKRNGSKLHLMGLVSKGGVHSHMDHLFALLDLAKEKNFKNIVIHAFLDGRDVLPNSGANDIKELEEKINELGFAKLATISGRYYAMDRDRRYERTKMVYDLLTIGSDDFKEDPISTIKDSYDRGVFDEFVVPFASYNLNDYDYRICDKDSVIFFNFRPDRARQLSHAILDEDFDGFERTKIVKDLFFVCMTPYDPTLKNVQIAYPKETYKNTLGEYISKKGLKQLRIAETEKYAHVTFFFNGGVEKANEGEDRILINSPKVATYDLKPEMSAYEVTENVVKEMNKSKYELIILNFANTDMVGHTGSIPATIKAVETVMECLKNILKAADDNDYELLITADHGNAERLIDEQTGGPYTAHTTNPVPVIYYTKKKVKLRQGGALMDLAPTLLDIMGLESPIEFEGRSLIERKN